MIIDVLFVKSKKKVDCEVDVVVEDDEEVLSGSVGCVNVYEWVGLVMYNFSVVINLLEGNVSGVLQNKVVDVELWEMKVV